MKASLGLPLLFLGVMGPATIAMAQSSPGTFTATGAMTLARYGHTATLLNNGLVLIAGGGPSFFSPTASAELYDPARGIFTPTGSMTTRRIFHTATVLPDGRVLITGGDGDSGVNILRGLTTAEVYDPSNGTFTATSGMIHGREGAHADLLNNGKVLLAGGSGSSPGQVPNAELYDPTTGSFANTGAYATDPNGFSTFAGAASTLLADGRVLMVWEDDLAEIYDPETGSFTQTDKPLGPSLNLSLATATLLMDGRVLVAGGDDGSSDYRSTELFGVPTGIFTPGGSMSAAHDTGSATLLPNGTVLIAGGGGPIGSQGATDVYDPVSGIFRAGPEMVTKREIHTATLLNDGRVLIAGGLLSAGASDTTSLAEVYTPDILTPAPVLLSVTGDAQGQGAILHAGTAQLVTAADPAVAGEYLSIYLNGLTDGSVIPPQVAIGGRLAEIAFFGNVPGYPGLNVVNVKMPSGVAPGPAVPLRLTYLSRPSNAVTIGVAEPFWQDAVTAMKTAAGTDSLNFWQWAWYWQYLPAFNGAPPGFGVGGSISPDVMERIIIAGEALR